MLGAITGGSELGEGNSTPVPEASGETEESATAGKRAQTHADAENEDDSQTDSKTEENPSGSGESDNSSDEDAIPLNGRNSGSGKEETSDTEQGRIPYHQSESLSEPVGGSVEKRRLRAGALRPCGG